MNKRRYQGAMMIAVLAALEQINAAAIAGELPSALDYRVEPLKLDELMPSDEQFTATFALADLFANSLVEPNLVLVEQINTLAVESRGEIARYIREYHDLYNEVPPALDAEPQTLLQIIEDLRQQGESEQTKLASEGLVDSVLPGLGKGPMKAPDVQMNDEGQVEVVTGLLPRTEIDPRTGTYKSENAVLQSVLDVVSVVDSQVPEPIRSTGTDVYNKVTEGLNGQP